MDASSFRLLDPNLLTESAYSDRVPGDLDALVADVAARGVLRSALVGIDGKVIGGWHRRLACQRLGLRLPAVVVPRVQASDERVLVTGDNDLDGFTARPDLSVEVGEELGEGWYLGVVSGDLGDLSGADRLKISFAQMIAARGGRGSVLCADGKVIDDWVWAAWYVMSGEPALLRVTDGPPSEVRSVGIWNMTPHPAMGRWGVKGNHRRISPLWQRVMAEGEPGRVLDMGCGWGWHLGQLPSEWTVTGYEPYRRLRNTDQIDKRWVRRSIRRVADDLRLHGLYDHVVLDHVLFLTGSTEAALTALDAATTLVKPGGSLWVSSYWYDLKSVAGRVDDRTRIGGRGPKRYVVRTWSKDDLMPELESRFDNVELWRAGETHLYRSTGPGVTNWDAVRTEFDLEWEDGTRPNVVDELMEAASCLTPPAR